MDRISRLEEEHARLHGDLLRSLDTLYLMKKTNNGSLKLSNEQIQQLETRTQLQLSLQKSVPLIRSVNSISRHEDESMNETSIPSAEKLLAQRLELLMEEDYQKTEQLFQLMNLESNEIEDLQRKHRKYELLVRKYKELSSKLDEKLTKQRTTSESLNETDSTALSDEELYKENETIEQLLIALKIHGGYLNFSTK